MSKSRNISFLVACITVLIIFSLMRFFLFRPSDLELDSRNMIRDIKHGIVGKQHSDSQTKTVTRSQDSLSPQYINYVGRLVVGFDTFAYIYDQKRQEKVLLKKSDTYDGYKLKKVDSKAIVLSRFGEDYKISLSKIASAVADKSNDAIADLGNNSRVVNLNAVVNEIDNVNELLKDSLYFPEVRSGKIVGVKIHKLSEHDLVSRSGFLEGDLVKSVNGVKLQGFADILKLYKTVSSFDDIQVSIERNGIEEMLHYKLER